MIHKCFSIPRKERTILKRIQKGIKTSFEAWRQIEVLILLDEKKESIAGIAELLEVGSKTITKWRNSYEQEGLKSLIFYEEKETKKKSIGIRKVTLKNTDHVNKEEVKATENEEKD